MKAATTASMRSPQTWGKTGVLSLLAMLGVFGAGMGAGLLSDNVRNTLSSWTEANAEPVGRQMPKHINRAYAETGIVTNASVIPAAQAVPQPAWFPPNNQVEWKVAMRPGDVPAGLAIQNASTQHNRILRFFIATGNPAQPWMQAADLYVGAGRQSELRLPRGRYLIQSIASPVNMPFEQAIRIRPANLAQVELFEPDTNGPANLRLTVHPDNHVTTFRLDTVVARQAASPRATARYASLDTSGESLRVSSQPEYAALMAEALNE